VNERSILRKTKYQNERASYKKQESQDTGIRSTVVIRFIEDNQEKFYRMAFGYMKNEQDALDAVHDAVVKILQNRSQVKSPEYFETWAYRILINECLMALRRQKKVVYLQEDDSLEDSTDRTGKQEKYVDLYHSMDRLPAKLKTVVLLRFFEDMQFDKIAEVTGDNINTVKSRLYKALKLLKLDLEVYDEV